MEVQQRSSVPGLTGLYAKAALPGLPGRRADALPRRALRVEGVTPDPEHVAAYAEVCGFAGTDPLPPTYVHLLAFPLAMELMTDTRFPFGVMGLVHVRNVVEHLRPVGTSEALDVVVHAEGLRAHDRGRQFDVVAEAAAGGEPVWRGRSTYLRREGSGGGEGRRDGDGSAPPAAADEWQVPGDIGRRYGAVSGDRNPIHLHPLTARLFGMPRPIAHGMWLKARCLAALSLPGAFTADVRFKLPLHIPATVAFAHHADGRFAVRDARTGRPHLEGTAG